MEKRNKPKKNNLISAESKVSKLEEPEVSYNRSVKIIPAVKNFTYSEFKKISDKAPFTQAEWASLLHISERTLQRYAKNNGSFAPINAERAMQIAQVINEGKKTFGKTELFYNWLKRKPLMLEGPLSFESLTTAYGIQLVLTQLGRIQHGILA
ncbi:MAG: hypothetical protein JWR61_5139 [Ferruginibacter sp.]|jgi:putative toxin-antitoxin system antitoxin component (TIGR02293 family)|uniref:type II RES/Xre toxin-antitoxin system antitoxin n=1 Tax=Ferruginibacter sp. TaxID=1940288 RepID=UPI002657C202|nr:antitoxin Xre-like helix-turn-helix domain-containing protein [Ferruginibacter sp.]MDB5280184.1 hypothetical protein [Ferruginibacter sp.]